MASNQKVVEQLNLLEVVFSSEYRLYTTYNPVHVHLLHTTTTYESLTQKNQQQVKVNARVDLSCLLRKYIGLFVQMNDKTATLSGHLVKSCCSDSRV